MSDEEDFVDRVFEIQTKGQELANKILEILSGNDIKVIGAALSYSCGSFLKSADDRGVYKEAKYTLIKSLDILSPTADTETTTH